jgi:hypothetical protein
MVFVPLLFPNISRGIRALNAGRDVGVIGRPEFFNEAEIQRIHDTVTSAALRLKCPNAKNLKKIVLETTKDQLELRGLNPEAAKLPSQKTFDKILKAATVDVVKKPSTQNERRLLVIAFRLIFRSQCRQLSIRATALAWQLFWVLLSTFLMVAFLFTPKNSAEWSC